MDAQRMALAQSCLDAAHAGSMSFPVIVTALIEAGFEGYSVDYRRGTATYYLPDGDSVTLESRSPAGPVAATFDAAGIGAQVAWAQSGAPDYSYAAFSDNVVGCGCAGYLVSFLGRRVLYFGRTAKTHVEVFPDAPTGPTPARPRVPSHGHDTA
ncbi:DUF1398 domain-containing protein [Acuticoccus sp. M5D2P5]|uniref:DUF1398 domain-containing protein n=1 Tax=Acuticoccus kalidii TaxID=2910977 RepID=UPI001F3416AC|nr:DUF1398 domain-containing protein [Acuticoccus kalidii]MCF3931827.1 DUF1398 domain-containing protein [Acuticoccus kalidii]